MHQRVGHVLADHLRVMRNELGLEAVVDTQVGGNRRQGGQQKFLDRIEPGIQRRRGHHQAIDRPQSERHKAARHQTTQAVAQQDQRQGSVCQRRTVRARQAQRALAGVIHHLGQVLEQQGLAGQAAALATRFTVTALVIGSHRKTPVKQMLRHMVVAARVLAQAMHHQHHGARWQGIVGLPGLHRPLVDRQVFAVAGRERRQQGIVHGWPVQGMRAMTDATAAVIFLA